MSAKFGLNPWVSIWTQPKKTIRSIVQNDPKYHFLYLATIYALQRILYISNGLHLSQIYNPIVVLLVAIIIAPTLGTIFLYFNTWILHFTGKWFGGEAPFLHVRAALSWSKVPNIITILMWFTLLVFSSEIFQNFTWQGPTSAFINLIVIIAGIWGLVILIQTIQEVQNFSMWRSIFNILTWFLLSNIIVFALIWLFNYIINFIKT